MGSRQLGLGEVRAAERAIECAVGEVLRALPFLWVRVDDPPSKNSQRSVFVRNSIALLSNHGRSPLDPPSSSWPGIASRKERIRSSGLWNSNHVDEQYDPTFQDALERQAERT